jgi:site-specific recombinase XerC
VLTTGDEARRMSDELVTDHLKHLRSGGASERTIESRRSVLKQLHNRLPFGLAYGATEQIEAWLSGLREGGRSRWTLAVYSYHVRSFYQWATKAGFLDGDPSAEIPRARYPRCLPKPIDEDELAQALSLAEPFRTAVILAAFAGLRASEIAACHREHVTVERLIVPDGKGGQPGSVPTHPYLWAHIQTRQTGPLITDRLGHRVTGHWLTVHIRGHFDAAGLPRVHLHRLRHRYGTQIQQLYGDIRVTQECMRHRSIASTEGYTQVTNARRTAAVNALPIPGAPAS